MSEQSRITQTTNTIRGQSDPYTYRVILSAKTAIAPSRAVEIIVHALCNAMFQSESAHSDSKARTFNGLDRDASKSHPNAH
jgi:hypothetical protein